MDAVRKITTRKLVSVSLVACVGLIVLFIITGEYPLIAPLAIAGLILVYHLCKD